MAETKQQQAARIAASPGPTQIDLREISDKLGGSWRYVGNSLEKVGDNLVEAMRAMDNAGLPIKIENATGSPAHVLPERVLGVRPDGTPVSTVSKAKLNEA